MSTEEKIKASIRMRLEAEGGQSLGFLRAQTRWGGILDLTPAPLLVHVYEDGTVSPTERPLRDLPTFDLRRADLSEDEISRLDRELDAVLVEASGLRRGDMAIVAHAKPARVELRVGPSFDPPKETK